MNDLRKDRQMRGKLAEGTFFPRPNMTKAEFDLLIRDSFGYRIASDLKPILKQLAALPDNNNAIPDDAFKDLQTATEAILKDTGGAGPAGIVFGIIALVGLGYVTWHFVH